MASPRASFGGRAAAPRSGRGALGGGFFGQIAAGHGGMFNERAGRAIQLMQLRNLLGAPPDAALAGGLQNLAVISGDERIALPDELLAEAVGGGLGGIVEKQKKRKSDQFKQLRIDPITGMVF